MAFSATEFLPIGPMGNSNAPRHYSYESTVSKATMVGSGYFDEAVVLGIQVKDIIHAVGATGGTETLTTIFVDAISAAGVVTTLSSVQTLA